MKLLIAVMVVMGALATAQSATAVPPASCWPDADPPYVGHIGYAAFMGDTVGCGANLPINSYNYTARVIDGVSGQVLAQFSGTEQGSTNLDFEPWTQCLAPNGTGRWVRSRLTISAGGYSRTSTSDMVLCKRQGGTAPSAP